MNNMHGIVKIISRPEIVFLLLALGFGTTFMIVTPPFQVPDEPNHFFRAYQISEGQFRAVKHDQRIGGSLPLSVKRFAQPFDHIIAGEKYTDDSIYVNAARIALQPQVRTFVDFNNTALYSPVCYLPQALGIAIFRVFDANVLSLFYAARVLATLVWIVLVYFAIRLIPVCKWLFCFLALLPMSLSINSSLSADVMTNGVCFLFIAVILHTRLTGNLSRERILLIGVLVFLLPMLKTIYLILSLLLLILPYRAITGIRNRILVPLVLMAITAASFFTWTYAIRDMYLTYEEYNPAYRDKAALVKGVDPEKQFRHMMQHRPIFFRMIRRSTFRLVKYHVPGYVGVFGWSDLKPPAWFSYTIFSFAVFFALGESDPKYRITWLMRFIFAVVFVLTLSAVFLTQYLTWTGLGPQVVKFIQPRYLIPFYPLMFLCLYSLLPVRKSLMAILVPVISFLSLAFSAFILIERYY